MWDIATAQEPESEGYRQQFLRDRITKMEKAKQMEAVGRQVQAQLEAEAIATKEQPLKAGEISREQYEKLSRREQLGYSPERGMTGTSKEHYYRALPEMPDVTETYLPFLEGLPPNVKRYYEGQLGDLYTDEIQQARELGLVRSRTSGEGESLLRPLTRLVRGRWNRKGEQR